MFYFSNIKQLITYHVLVNKDIAILLEENKMFHYLWRKIIIKYLIILSKLRHGI